MAPSGEITDRNVIGMESGKYRAITGSAHELIVAGILARLGFEGGLILAQSNPYDLWVVAYNKHGGEIRPLRVQVKTAGPSIPFTAGSRGGVDRDYVSDEKVYKYTEEHNDLIIGVDNKTLDLYLLPTRMIKKWGKSKSIRKLQPLKNNWEILLNWNDEYLEKLDEMVPG